MTTIDDIADMLAEIEDDCKSATRYIRRSAFRIIPKPVQGKRGRRARRQAFYSRQRVARVFRRLSLLAINDRDAIERSHLDAIYGETGVLEVSESGARRVPPAEWRAE